MKNKEEFDRLMSEANNVKDDLYRIVQGLEEAGYHRKANSGMTIIWRIEDWQNRR